MGELADERIEYNIFGRQKRRGMRRGSMRVPKDYATPAPPGSDLAKARIAAHAAFDPLWQSGRMSRTRAYSELARRLGIPKHRAHMQMFDVATCERVVALFLADDFETLEDDFSDLL